MDTSFWYPGTPSFGGHFQRNWGFVRWVLGMARDWLLCGTIEGKERGCSIGALSLCLKDVLRD
ncbi:hypothetical protein LINPERPRIM_LOCUS23853 [Linum perenne]